MNVVAVLGLHFDGALDLTGLATLVLAGATAVLAFKTRDAAKAAADEAAITARQVEFSQRPVVVPASMPSFAQNTASGELDFFVTMAVRNVGPGPAINLWIGTATEPEKGLGAGSAIGERPFPPPLGPGDVGKATVLARRIDNGRVDFRFDYEDVAGQKYLTHARCDMGEKRVDRVELYRWPSV